MAKSSLPITSKSADHNETSSECCTNIGNDAAIGHHDFDYTLNTTACADGTFCPNPNNQTCCFNHQGFTLTSYHYDAALPTAAAALSTFYAENGYQLTNTTSSSSKSLPTTSPSSPLPILPSTSSPTSTYINASPTDRNSPSPLNTGTKAGIGIAVAGSLSIAGIVLLLLCRVRRRRRDDRRHPRISEATDPAPLDQRQWEKPELIGEDARKEMEAEERRRPELPGEGARAEMGAADLRHMIVSELHS